MTSGSALLLPLPLAFSTPCPVLPVDFSVSDLLSLTLILLGVAAVVAAAAAAVEVTSGPTECGRFLLPLPPAGFLLLLPSLLVVLLLLLLLEEVAEGFLLLLLLLLLLPAGLRLEVVGCWGCGGCCNKRMIVLKNSKYNIVE